MNAPCKNHVCYCPSGDPDSPIANLTAEGPDMPAFFSDPVPWVPPNINHWRAADCRGDYCVSYISEVDAQRCAARKVVDCSDPAPGCDDTCPPDGNGDGNGGEDGCTGPDCTPVPGNGWTNTPIYYNVLQTCTKDCPNGDTFTHSIAAGTIASHVSQEDADLKALSLCVNEATLLKLCFGADMLPACTESYYEHIFTVTGGTPPYNIQLDYMTAPTGFALDQGTGLFSGTATTGGLYDLALSVTDSSVPATASYQVFPFYVLEITTDTLPDGKVGTAYLQTLTSVPPGIGFWSVTNGSLPPGLTLNAVTGIISGTPTGGGTFNFEVELLA